MVRKRSEEEGANFAPRGKVLSTQPTHQKDRILPPAADLACSLQRGVGCDNTIRGKSGLTVNRTVLSSAAAGHQRPWLRYRDE